MKRKILIADDEPDVLESTARLVEAMGYDVVRIAHAKGIPGAVKQERPDVLLQDVKMPGLDIAVLVAAVRSDPASAELPIVLMSANDDVPDTAARLDVWGFLNKPFAEDELARLLREAIRATAGAAADTAASVEEDVRERFRDFWRVLGAMSDALEILNNVPSLPPDLRKVIRGLDDVLWGMESKTERLTTNFLRLLRTAKPRASKSASKGSSEPVVGFS